MMFFKPRKTHLVGGMVIGAVVGMSLMGAVCLCNDKNLCKKLKKDAMNVGNMVKQGINQIF